MANLDITRFKFIGFALNGDGPFRPLISYDSKARPIAVASSYLIQYPRESETKYARRNEIAWYASPLAQVVSRFTSYLSTRTPVRSMANPLYEAMADDIDGKGNSIDVFWSEFMREAKARGSMLLLVDMPPSMAPTLDQQLRTRVAPYWTAIKPELLTDYEIGDDGKFNYAEFSGNFTQDDAKRVECTWHFDRTSWRAVDGMQRTLAEGEHPLNECPLLIFTEGGDFPHFGSFAPIADLSRRMFNLDSELDEILRSQTFSLLTMQVSENSTDAQKVQAAQVVGETIGSSNLMVHSGSTPAFIAPPDGPARIYLDRIAALRDQINEIGLVIASSSQRESGLALQMRFQTLNSELAKFASRMEDLEARAWELSRQWLGLTTAPEVMWSRDFNMADVANELDILASMQASAMPTEVIAEQQRRIVAVQFGGLDQVRQDQIHAAIDQRLLEQA
ncbi:MAG: hypothetical protein RI906_1101 [Pseudomonadota bacterium]|jgi:hypothetical protein